MTRFTGFMGLTGLLEKTTREIWRMVALTSAGLALVMGLFVQILPQFQSGLNDIILQVPFIRTLISGLMGMDVSAGLSPQMLLVVVWSHPIILATVWGFAIALGTRVPAAEIERGTIDVLLGWPVSRRTIYLSEMIVCVVAGFLLLGSGFLGFVISSSTLPSDLKPNFGNAALTLVNLFAVHVAVGGTVQCISAACDRRGTAMGMSIAFVLGSFLVQFLSTLWPPAERVVFASFAHYYQPAQVMLSGTLPVENVLVLLGFGIVLWVIGGAVWSRRSVLTI